MESMKSIECPPSELPIVDRGSCDGGLDYQQCMNFWIYGGLKAVSSILGKIPSARSGKISETTPL